jgi:hypothetical protein
LYGSHFSLGIYGRWYNGRRLPGSYERLRDVVDEPWLRIEGIRVEDGVGQELGLVQRLESCVMLAPEHVLWARRARMRTFVAVYECVLDDDGPPVGGCELLRLAPGLPEAACIPDMVVWAHAARHSQHMAG